MSQDYTREELEIRQKILEQLKSGYNLTDKQRDLLEDIVKSQDKYVKSVNKSQRALEDANYNFKNLDKALQSGRKRYVDLASDLERLSETIEDLDDVEKQAKQRKIDELATSAKWATAQKAVVDSIGVAAEAYIKYQVGASKSVINSYQSNASAFQAAGDIASLQIDRNAEVVKGMTGAVGGAMTGMAALTVATGGAGAALWAIGAAATEVGGYLWSVHADLEKFKIQALTKEMDGAISAMREASSAGAMFSGGLMELRQSAQQAFLDQTSYAKVLSDNRESLARYSGSVTQGMKEFNKINGAMGPYREGLLNLGYSLDDIADGSAKYMGVLGLVAGLQKKTAEETAKDTADWLTNIRAISAFTGEDAKKAQERAEAATLQTAVFSRLREEAEAGGGTQEEVAERLSKLIAGYQNNLKSVGDDQNAQLAYMQQRIYGFITNEVMLSQGSTAPEILNVIRQSAENSKRINDEQAINGKATVDYIRANSQTILKQVGGSPFGTANLLTGEYGPQQALAQNFEKLAIKGTKVGDVFDQAAKAYAANDPLKYAQNVVAWQNKRMDIMASMDQPLLHFRDMIVDVYKDIDGFRKKLGWTTNAERASSANEKQKRLESGYSGGEDLAGASMDLWNAMTGTKETKGLASTATIRDLIASVESTGSGGYSATVKAGQQDLSQMTIDDILKHGADFGAVGRYQFISSTLSKVAKEAGVDTGTKFTPDIQDRLADQLLQDIGYNQYATGNMSKEDFLKSMANQWRGLPSSPGMRAGSATDNVGNKTGLSWDDAMQKFAKGGVTNGPSIAGEAGPEAVVPLPDGRTIPVKMDVGELVEKLEEMILVMKDHRDTSEKILHASS